MTYPNGARAPEPRGAMHVRHYRQRAADSLPFGVLGCGCRGCLLWYRKQRDLRVAKLANAQVAEPFRELLNSFGRAA